MIKDGLIRYYRHADEKRTYRICDPAGFKAIAECDPRLLEHVEMLVGKNKRYTGSKTYRLKKRREAELMLDLLNAGIVVDGFLLNEDKSVQLLSPSLIEPETIIKNAGDNAPLFLSGAMLRHKGTTSTHKRREMSISTGTLFTRGGTYTTFFISSDRYRWYAAAETASANDIIRMYEDVKDIERRRDGRFRAILYVNTEDVAAELLKLSAVAGHKMNPVRIFKLSYLVPCQDRELATVVTKMLALPEWRKKADRVLGMTPDDKCDGHTVDGKRVYNLLCCNIARVLDIAPDVRKHRCRLIIHDWQKPILEEFYGTNIDAIVLEKKHFRGLLMTIEEEDGYNRNKN